MRVQFNLQRITGFDSGYLDVIFMYIATFSISQIGIADACITLKEEYIADSC